ncbi:MULTISPECIES: 5-oxoprolinase subunit PxpB [Alteromonas]|jgi:KipI family sensor histidine kinase inhibitor|uniref:5-oxoprolinase subunit PxpB n=1 Tax=Alteromonas TaxID=226 RepID=UPI001E5722F4|nr:MULTISPECIES: 5-oxoprolinase subunit PxpB [Alteromonas]|tara:strand:+ start:2383 stop:3090 length:708 start_codon:yes stop_codon:yes gene_type:complete
MKQVMQPFGTIQRIVPVGIDALMIYFKGEKLDEANAYCQQWVHALTREKRGFSWIVECVPAYDSLMLVFDPFTIDSHGVYMALSTLATQDVSLEKQQDIKVLSVWYGAEGANDLARVAQTTGLTEDSIVQMHGETIYKVYAVGFAPGFAYMADTPPRLHCPRLSTPRKRVPKGAVAIADNQTAVYPSESPGGWHLLGLCPDLLVDSHNHASFLAVGDSVKFEPISEQEFRARNAS